MPTAGGAGRAACEGGQVVPCDSLGQEGTHGKDFNALPGCLSPVGVGVHPDGFNERRAKKGGHEGPVEVGN